MIKIEVEKVNAERTNVRFAVYANEKIWLKVSFVKDHDGRVHSLFKCREFYDENGRLVNRGHTVVIPNRPKNGEKGLFEQLQKRALAILN